LPWEELNGRCPQASVPLDVGFRMPQVLFGPISDAVYKGQLRAHASCEDRPAGVALHNSLKRFEIDSKGDSKWQQLGHCMMVFNIPSSQ
jgi:hypothetical protein